MSVNRLARYSPGFRRRRALAAVAVTAAAGVVVPVATATTPAAAATVVAPVYRVTSEGLTADGGKALAERASIPNALLADGSFRYQSATFAQPPLVTVGEGRDEEGLPVVSQAVDHKALAALKVLPAAEAQQRAAALVPVPGPYAARVTVGNTTVEELDARGVTLTRTPIDTTVSYQLFLAGFPVIGPGARLGVSFAGDGSVSRLNLAVRGVEKAAEVTVIGTDAARKRCAAETPGIAQGVPRLAYYAPPLAAAEASGKGAATLLTPQYVCQPANVSRDAVSALTGRLIPAAPSLTPTLRAVADFDGRTLVAKATVRGGTAPYSYQWGSSSTVLPSSTSARPSVSYAPKSRERGVETVTLTVTDANGATTSVALTPSTEPGAPGHAEATGRAGGIGGAFAEAGIEQTVDEWACAQASAQGFREVMRAQAQSVNFDWRGTDAWERDFRDPSLGGTDTTYVDGVDIAWYTGHGGPGGFTFKNTSRDDGSITPADASWGNTDLEWLNLESCQVLRDTTGSGDFFGRWGPTMDGLHLINGFDTNATCVGPGTGRLFASLLFPQNLLFFQFPALTVAQAWATTANSLEPAGTKWRSLSLVSKSGVSNLGDHFWGQGPTGPDLTYAGRGGMIAVSGIV